jgi:DNA topoisomerase-1
MAVLDEGPWWRRTGSPKRGFRYRTERGKPITSARSVRRIEKMAIPPAWSDVRISPDPARHVQAWGIDAAGRRQYRYSLEAVEARDRRRWRRVLRFGRLLPQLRDVTNEHLQRPDPDRLKVLATVVRLMNRAFFRVGSERYAVQNRTFGLVTLKKRHLRIDGSNLVFTYVGKQRKDQRGVVADTPLVDIIEDILELPGSRLFRYIDAEGRVRDVTATAVNAYIREILGERHTSKDLRTFGGTVRAATILADLGPATSPREAHRNIVMCTRLVASDLGNTPAIARSAYIHPTVLGQYEFHGRTMETHMPNGKRPVSARETEGLYPEEAALIRFLERWPITSVR